MSTLGMVALVLAALVVAAAVILFRVVRRSPGEAPGSPRTVADLVRLRAEQAAEAPAAAEPVGAERADAGHADAENIEAEPGAGSEPDDAEPVVVGSADTEPVAVQQVAPDPVATGASVAAGPPTSGAVRPGASPAPARAETPAVAQIATSDTPWGRAARMTEGDGAVWATGEPDREWSEWADWADVDESESGVPDRSEPRLRPVVLPAVSPELFGPRPVPVPAPPSRPVLALVTDTAPARPAAIEPAAAEPAPAEPTVVATTAAGAASARSADDDAPAAVEPVGAEAATADTAAGDATPADTAAGSGLTETGATAAGSAPSEAAAAEADAAEADAVETDAVKTAATEPPALGETVDRPAAPATTGLAAALPSVPAPRAVVPTRPSPAAAAASGSAPDPASDPDATPEELAVRRRTAAETAAEQAAADLALLRTFGCAPTAPETVVDDEDDAPMSTSLSAAAAPPPVAGAAQTVAFRVVGRDGDGIDAAGVTLLDDRGRETTAAVADAKGRGEVRAPHPGSYMLVSSAPGHQPGAVALTVAGEPVEAEVLLARSASVTGTVFGEDGPIVGARLTLVQDGEIVDTTGTGPDGEYWISDLAAGEYGLSVSAHDCEPVALLLTVPDETDLRHDVEMVPVGLPAPATPVDDDLMIGHG